MGTQLPALGLEVGRRERTSLPSQPSAWQQSAGPHVPGMACGAGEREGDQAGCGIGDTRKKEGSGGAQGTIKGPPAAPRGAHLWM